MSAHSSSVNALESLSDSLRTVLLYCAFQKHVNSEVLKPPWYLRFSLPESIITVITSNELQSTEAQKNDRSAPIKNHKQWPFEPIEVNYSSLNTQTSVGFCPSEFACFLKSIIIIEFKMSFDSGLRIDPFPRGWVEMTEMLFFPLDRYVEKFELQQILVKYS